SSATSFVGCSCRHQPLACFSAAVRTTDLFWSQSPRNWEIARAYRLARCSCSPTARCSGDAPRSSVRIRVRAISQTPRASPYSLSGTWVRLKSEAGSIVRQSSTLRQPENISRRRRCGVRSKPSIATLSLTRWCLPRGGKLAIAAQVRRAERIEGEVTPHPIVTSLPHPRACLGIVQQTYDCASHRIGVAWRGQQPCHSVHHHLRSAAMPGRNDGQRARHGLEDRRRKRIGAKRRLYEDIESAEQRR